jgi:hypothetical protein
MKANILDYVEAYVSAQRIARRIKRHDAEWARWLRRVEVARKVGDVALAQAAADQALLHGEAAAQLGKVHAEQEAELSRLLTLAQTER